MQRVGGQIIRGQIQTVNKTTMSIQTVTQNITNPISAIAWFMLLNPIILSHSIHTTPSLYPSLSLASQLSIAASFYLFYIIFCLKSLNYLLSMPLMLGIEFSVSLPFWCECNSDDFRWKSGNTTTTYFTRNIGGWKASRALHSPMSIDRMKPNNVNTLNCRLKWM